MSEEEDDLPKQAKIQPPPMPLATQPMNVLDYDTPEETSSESQRVKMAMGIAFGLMIAPIGGILMAIGAITLFLSLVPTGANWHLDNLFTGVIFLLIGYLIYVTGKRLYLFGRHKKGNHHE